MSVLTDSTTAPTQDDPPLRASDADRHRVEHLLQHALGAGMLTLDETEERLAAAHAARFRHELPPLTADLPVEELGAGPAAPAGRRARLLALLLALSTWVQATVRGASVRRRVLGGLVLLVAALLVVGVLGAGFHLALSHGDLSHGDLSPGDREQLRGR